MKLAEKVVRLRAEIAAIESLHARRQELQRTLLSDELTAGERAELCGRLAAIESADFDSLGTADPA